MHYAALSGSASVEWASQLAAVFSRTQHSHPRQTISQRQHSVSSLSGVSGASQRRQYDFRLERAVLASLESGRREQEARSHQRRLRCAELLRKRRPPGFSDGDALLTPTPAVDNHNNNVHTNTNNNTNMAKEDLLAFEQGLPPPAPWDAPSSIHDDLTQLYDAHPNNITTSNTTNTNANINTANPNMNHSNNANAARSSSLNDLFPTADNGPPARPPRTVIANTTASPLELPKTLPRVLSQPSLAADAATQNINKSPTGPGAIANSSPSKHATPPASTVASPAKSSLPPLPQKLLVPPSLRSSSNANKTVGTRTNPADINAGMQRLQMDSNSFENQAAFQTLSHMGFPTTHIAHVLHQFPAATSHKLHIDRLILYSEAHPFPPTLVDTLVTSLGIDNEHVQKHTVKELLYCVKEVMEVGFELKKVADAMAKTYGKGKKMGAWKEEVVEWLLTHDGS